MGEKILKPKRVVLDTNVVVSALVFSSPDIHGLRQSWQNELFIPLISKPTAQELLRVLSYPKFQLNEEEKVHLLSEYLPYCTTINVPAWHLESKGICRDPADDIFLTLAVTGKAVAIISGDNDLLSLKNYEGIPILSLREWRAQFEF